MPFDRLFIRARGQTYGPFTIEQIGQAILERRLTPSHEVSSDGESWFAAGTIWNEIRPIIPGPPDQDDSHRRRRRRSRGGSQSDADESRAEPTRPRPQPDRAEAGSAGRSSAMPPPESPAPPAPSPTNKPPVPPLPPRPNTGPATLGPQPSGPSVGGPQAGASSPAPSSSGAPPLAAETVAVPKVDPNLKATAAELELSDSAAEPDPTGSRRRRRRSGSQRSGSRRSGRDADEALDRGELSRASLPTVAGIAARISPAVLGLLLIAHLFATVYLLSALWGVESTYASRHAVVTDSSREEFYAASPEVLAEIEKRAEIRKFIFMVEAALWVLSATLFLVWKYGVNDCLRRSGVTGLRFSPGACVGWYFVPVAGLFKPYQAMKELWIASDPYPYDRRRDSGGWIAAWWSLGILGGIAALIAWLVLDFVSRDENEMLALYRFQYWRLHVEPFFVAYGLAMTIIHFILITKLANRLSQKAVVDAAYEAES